MLETEIAHDGTDDRALQAAEEADGTDTSRAEEAIVDAHRALELNPDYLVAYQPLLEAHYKLGRVDDAVPIILKSLES